MIIILRIIQFKKSYIQPTNHMTNKRFLILSDIHVPYQHKLNLSKAIEYGKKYNPTDVVLLGDVIDCVSISKFLKKSNERDFNKEILQTRKFLQSLRNTFPKANISYLEGNHENRLNKYILTNASELSNLKELSLPSLLQLDKYNIKYYSEDKILKAGNLVLTHGHLVKGSCSSYPARSLFYSTKVSSLCGHCHRESMYTCRTIDNKVLKSYSVGCLSTLQPSYSIFNDFTAGFAVIDVISNKAEVKLISL